MKIIEKNQPKSNFHENFGLWQQGQFPNGRKTAFKKQKTLDCKYDLILMENKRIYENR